MLALRERLYLILMAIGWRSCCVCTRQHHQVQYMNKLPPTPSRSYRGHSLPLTCVALSPDDNTIFTGSKDCCFIQRT